METAYDIILDTNHKLTAMYTELFKERISPEESAHKLVNIVENLHRESFKSGFRAGKTVGEIETIERIAQGRRKEDEAKSV